MRDQMGTSVTIRGFKLACEMILPVLVAGWQYVLLVQQSGCAACMMDIWVPGEEFLAFDGCFNFRAGCQLLLYQYFIIIVILLPLKEMLFQKGHEVPVHAVLRFASSGDVTVLYLVLPLCKVSLWNQSVRAKVWPRIRLHRSLDCGDQGSVASLQRRQSGDSRILRRVGFFSAHSRCSQTIGL